MAMSGAGHAGAGLLVASYCAVRLALMDRCFLLNHNTQCNQDSGCALLSSSSSTAWMWMLGSTAMSASTITSSFVAADCITNAIRSPQQRSSRGTPDKPSIGRICTATDRNEGRLLTVATASGVRVRKSREGIFRWRARAHGSFRLLVEHSAFGRPVASPAPASGN